MCETIINMHTDIKTNVSPLVGLKENVKNLELAHKACRDINMRMDSLLNIFILLLSAIITCLETTIDTNKYDTESIHLSKIVLSSTVTFFAGLHTFFQNAQKSEKHHTISRQYLNLELEIDRCMRNNINDNTEYDILYKKFSEIRTHSISLFWFIRKSYKIC